MTDVDAFIAAKVLADQQDTVALLRALMSTEAPDTVLSIRYGLPMWTRHGHIAYLSPSKTAITFGFPYGVNFDDPSGVLKGRGKHARHLRFRRPSDVDTSLIAGFIHKALALDEMMARR